MYYLIYFYIKLLYMKIILIAGGAEFMNNNNFIFINHDITDYIIVSSV
jgi:hypothetical protein